MLEELIQICKDNNYVKPYVYQGQYNVICRRIETTLFPVLRANGMVFAAFRFGPLAVPFFRGVRPPLSMHLLKTLSMRLKPPCRRLSDR